MPLLNLLPPFAMGLIEPGFLLYYAVEAYVSTLLTSLRQSRGIPSDLRGKAFGKFWGRISGAPPDPSVPLVGSATLVPPLLAQASGSVLEVGPGSGSQTRYYEPAAGQIRAIYGVEPATELRQLLRKNVDATKLGPSYQIVSADATRASIARELVKGNIIRAPDDVDGMFDTVVCIRVLCSVPNPEAAVSDLHSLLKPGGKLLIVEHTVNAWRTPKGSLIARMFQTMYMLLGWSYFIGDCSLTRDIEDMLRKDRAQRWESIDIERHFGRAALPYISGVLVKKG